MKDYANMLFNALLNHYKCPKCGLSIQTNASLLHCTCGKSWVTILASRKELQVAQEDMAFKVRMAQAYQIIRSSSWTT